MPVSETRSLAPKSAEADAYRGLPARSMPVVAVFALVALVLEIGFDLGPGPSLWLQQIEFAIAALIAVDLAACLLRADSPVRVLRQRWYEYVLLLVFALSLGLVSWIATGEAIVRLLQFVHLASVTKLCLALADSFILLNLLIRFLRAQERILATSLSPEVLLIGSFAALILLGTLLLLLPRSGVADRPPITVLDALFTSTSASCVTGLAVRDTGSDYSILGHMTIIALMEIGGFGLIIFVALGSILSAKTFSVPQMVALREIFNARTLSDVRRHIVSIVVLMLLVEAVGVLCLFLSLPEAEGPLLWRIHWSVFHSVSAFCNAGLGLERDNLESYGTFAGILCTVMGLIVLGGLGMPVLRDLLAYRITTVRFFRRWRFFRRFHAGRIPSRLSLFSKLALQMTAFLLLLGFVGFWLLERNYALRDQSLPQSALTSAFQSVVPRTAGFDSTPIGTLRDPTLLLLMFLMVIGAGPVSTGGGVKTVTFGVLVYTMRSFVTGRTNVEAQGRNIPRRVVRTAICVFLAYMTVALLVTFVLSLSDPQVPLLARAFETVSALSTVGLSMGITAGLSATGKLALCFAMFIGRVGPLSLALSIFRSRRSFVEYSYPEEELVVG